MSLASTVQACSGEAITPVDHYYGVVIEAGLDWTDSSLTGLKQGQTLLAATKIGRSCKSVCVHEAT
jgi:hypothetical protein